MINIAILGMGVVGGGVAGVIESNKTKIASVLGEELNVKYVLDKRSFPGHPLENRVVGDIGTILSDSSVKVVAETMGGDNPAYAFSLACIRAGKSVVTSNKCVVENHGRELCEEAAKYGVHYLFEASVGGGIPVLHPITHCLAGNNITAVTGILNGTTNYMLGRMEAEACSFDKALSEAQSLGYAEADPTADVEGLDAARKICILATLCFGSWYGLDDCAAISGITAVTPEMIAEAKKLGYRIKLIGRAEKRGEGVRLFVSPCLVGSENLLSSVNDVFNCITVTGDAVGDVAFYGHGAGGIATASAVISDIIEAIRSPFAAITYEQKQAPVKSLSFDKTENICGTVLPVIS